jgi:hypothetical protein
MRDIPMIAFPKAAPVKLSKALETHRAHIGSYSRYAPVKRIACDECVNVLHEAGGIGQPPLGAKHSRRAPLGQLRLCTPHAELWRAIDGVGKGRR